MGVAGQPPVGDITPEGGEVGVVPTTGPDWVLPVDCCRFIGFALMRAWMGLPWKDERMIIRNVIEIPTIMHTLNVFTSSLRYW